MTIHKFKIIIFVFISILFSKITCFAGVKNNISSSGNIVLLALLFVILILIIFVIFLSFKLINKNKKLYLLNVDTKDKATLKNIIRQTSNAQNLIESEERLLLALESTRSGIWDMNIVNGELFLSDRFYEILGLHPERDKLTALGLIELTYKDDKRKFINAVEDHFSKRNKVIEVEYRIRTKSNGLIWVHSMGRVVERDSNNDPVRFVGIITDITERKKAEIAKQESEKLFKEVVEAAYDGIFFLDIKTYKCTYVNKAGAVLLGYTKDEIYEFDSILECFANTHHGKDKVGQWFKLKSVGKETSSEFGTELVRKNRSLIKIIISNSVVNFNGEKMILSFIKDITERENAQQDREKLIERLEILAKSETQARKDLEILYKETSKTNIQLEQSQKQLKQANLKLESALNSAEEANRLKSEFLAIMSHELRTPLTGMLGFSQLLLMEHDLNLKQKQFARRIYRAGNRLLDVLSDLLEISVLEAGGVSIEYAAFNINAMVDDIYVLLEDQIAEKNINFITELNGISKVKSAPSRIRQLLFNLIGNAVKFTYNGDIMVRLNEANDKYLFEVIDTGIGIEEKNFHVIFEMFQQGEHVHNRNFGGTGLGLAICKKLVAALDGEIGLESEPGKGSRFYFFLPIVDMEKVKNISSDKTVMSINEQNSFNVLFADDDTYSFQFLHELFSEDENINAVGFNNGRDLFEHYYSNRVYDLIILDIQMPHLDGVECLLKIREFDKEIPVIALTAYAMQSDKEKYLQLGFTDYISKPIKVSDFINIINNHIYKLN